MTPPSNLTDASNLPEGVIHDISGTTIYVVAVIAIIPMAGIVAWLVRFVVKKKVKVLTILIYSRNLERSVILRTSRGRNPGPRPACTWVPERTTTR